MSGSGSRRRRSSSRSRRPQAPLQVSSRPRRHRRVGPGEIAASIGVVLAGAALIALIWIVSMRNVGEQIADVRERAEHTVSAQAAILAEEVRLELSIIDQSLQILQDAWAKDEGQFELLDWQKRVPALTAVATDIFIADEKRIVRQDIMPQALGQGVGGAYLNFPHGSLEVLAGDSQQTKVSALIIADLGGAVETRRELVYIVRPLVKPTDWIIGASYRTQELPKLFGQARPGINGVVALMDPDRGTVQAIAGPAARRPHGDISKSVMLTAFKAKPAGVWTGPTATDDVVRIHGFAKVPDRNMIVTVGVVQTEAMAPADLIASGIWWVAFGGSAVVVAVAGLILWEIFNLRANRRRQREYARMQADLDSAQHEVGGVRALAATATAQVASLLRVSNEGLALLDPELRLTAWNARFAAGVGIPDGGLRPGLPVDELIRQQAHAGSIHLRYGEDAEALEQEVAQRVAILRTEPEGATLPHVSTDGTHTAIRVDPIANDGGLVLALSETTNL